MDPVWSELSRRLGARPGREIEPPAGLPAILETGDDDRRFLVVRLADRTGGGESLRLVRMQTAVDGLHTAALEEHRALRSPELPERGTCRPDPEFSSPGEDPGVLPPILYCKQTRKWIAAWCSRRAWAPGAADGTACAACGTADRGDCRQSTALEVLWHGVQQSLGKGATASGSPQPACNSCERRRACFPANASPSAPQGALEALVPVQLRPWVGVVLEPFQLPLEAWSGWIQSAGAAPPAAVPEALRLPADPGLHRLVPTEFRTRSAAEDLMLRLEALAVLLQALGSLIERYGRGHGSLRPEDVWFRVARGSAAVPLTWCAEPVLLDLAPDTARAAGRMVPELRPPQQGASGPIITGMLIPRGETTEGEARRGAKFMFIPEDKCEHPPDEGSPLYIVPADAPGEVVEGHVENAFQDVFRVVVYLGDRSADELTDLVTALGKPVSLGVGTRPRGEANPDLYALGTIWFALLRRGRLDLTAAAKFRDYLLGEMTKAGIEPTHHAAAVQCCRQAALDSGAFLVKPRQGYDVAASPEAQILARGVWIGARMTQEIPGEAGIAGVREAVRHLARETAALAEQARYLMLGRPSSADEILSVVDLLEDRELRR